MSWLNDSTIKCKNANNGQSFPLLPHLPIFFLPQQQQQAERPGWKLKLRVEDIDIGDITYGTCNDVLHVYDQNTNTGVPLVI